MATTYSVTKGLSVVLNDLRIPHITLTCHEDASKVHIMRPRIIQIVLEDANPKRYIDSTSVHSTTEFLYRLIDFSDISSRYKIITNEIDANIFAGYIIRTADFKKRRKKYTPILSIQDAISQCDKLIKLRKMTLAEAKNLLFNLCVLNYPIDADELQERINSHEAPVLDN